VNPSVVDPLRAHDYVDITGYREIEEVLRRGRDFVFGDGKAESADLLGGTIVTLDGPDHLQRRRVLAKMIDVRQPWGPEGALFDEAFARNLGELRAREAAADGLVRFDLMDFARKVFWQTLAAMIGFDSVDKPELVELLQSLVLPIVNAASVEFSKLDHDQIAAAGRAAIDQVRVTFFDPAVDRRIRQVLEADGDTAKLGALPGDLITSMVIAAGGTPDRGLVLRDALAVFAAAVNNPVNQTAYQLEDLEAWLAEHPGDRELLHSDAFFDRAAQETVRLHRTGNPYLVRQALHDADLQTTGRHIERGQWIALWIGQGNLDQSVFGDNAASFNPHRRVDQRGVKPYGLGFGAGPHVCLGRPLLIWGQGDEAAALGLQARMLKALVHAGVRVDPGGAREIAAHAAERYVRFGVFLGESLSPPAGP